MGARSAVGACTFLSAIVVAAEAAAATTIQAHSLTGNAHEAALRGECKTVDTIAHRVVELDATYYVRVFASDPVIANCREGVAVREQSQRGPPSATPPSVPVSAEPSFDGRVPARPRSHDHTGGAIAGALVGPVCGIALGLVSGIVALAIFDDEGSALPLGALGAGSAGYALGTSTMITVAGNHKDGKGSFAASLTGAVVGTAVGYGVLLATSHDVDDGLALPIVTLLGMPLAGSLIGYWVRHKDTAPSSGRAGALFHVRDGQVGLAVPTPIIVGSSHAPGLVLSAGTF